MSDPKYIDAEKLKRHYAWWDDEAKKIFDEIIDLQPAADVAEVVRCRECKWFGDIGCAIRIVDDSDRPSENDFCSFAERKTMDDLISRQAAIDALNGEFTITGRKNAETIRNYINGVDKRLRELPSAERRGRWIYDEWKGWCCSECGNQAPFWCLASTQNLTDYCPNCGARMKASE